MKQISLLALSTIALVPLFTHAMEGEKKAEASLVDLDFSKLNYPGLYAAQAHPITMQATAAQKELRLNFVQLHNKTKDKPLLTYINFWYEGFKLLSRRSKACHTLATSHFSKETTLSAVLNSCFAPQEPATDPITPQKVFGDAKKKLETLIEAAEGGATSYGREDGTLEIMPLWKRMLLNHNPYKLLGGTISIVASVVAMIKAKDDPALTPAFRSIACGLCGIVQIAGVGIIKQGINEYYKSYQKAHKRISSLVDGVTNNDTVLVDIEKTTKTKMIPA